MSQPEQIPVPDNKPEESFISEGAWEIRAFPDDRSQEGKCWSIYPQRSTGVEEAEDVQMPYLVTSWLLKGTRHHTTDLISPYAKLEITREPADMASETEGAADRKAAYRFRLVSMEEINESTENQEDAKGGLEEFKLLAGGVFRRRNDESALFACHVALSSFGIGKLLFVHPDDWEKHFS